VMDNLNIHHKKPLTDLYGAEFGGEIWDRFTVHYTPTHGSWLNQAEIEIGIFLRIPVKWGTDSGDVGQCRSEATLGIFMISVVPHMSQESSGIGI